MKTSRYLITILLVGILLLAGCNANLKVGSLQSESKSVDLGEAKSVDVQIDFGAGNLSVASGTQGLLDADFEYNVAELKPQVEFEDSTLVVQQPDVKGFPVALGIGEFRNDWDLRLYKDVPMDLSVAIGGGTIDLQLAELSLTRLDINIGAGVSTIDLNNNWAHDLDVFISTGAADTTVQLPKDIGVRVEVESAPTFVEAPGMTKDGNAYVNSAYGESPTTLLVKMEPGIGRIYLELEDEAAAAH